MKKFMVICAPITSRSGYGDHARDLFHSFHETGKFDISIFESDIIGGQASTRKSKL